MAHAPRIDEIKIDEIKIDEIKIDGTEIVETASAGGVPEVPRHVAIIMDGGHCLPDAVLILVGELATPAIRGARPDGAAAALHPQ